MNKPQDTTPPKCRKSVLPKGIWRPRKCSRAAWTDGWCKQHHPDTVKARNKASKAKFKGQIARDMVRSPKDITCKLIKCRALLREIMDTEVSSARILKTLEDTKP
jgi:hypothetical protein